MRCDRDDVSLLATVLGHLKEPDLVWFARQWRGIDHSGLNDCCQLASRAESLPARLAGADDIRPAGISQIAWRVGLFYRVEGKETGNIVALDSNLVAHRAANRTQHCWVSRAAFRLILKRVLL